jgi:hypothetical protein
MKYTSPVDGLSRAPSMWSDVLLPVPDWPTMASISRLFSLQSGHAQKTRFPYCLA